MVTKIRLGDIVEYQGKRVRVMSVDPTLPYLKCQFSHFGWLIVNSLDDIKLIESSPDTILKAGDKVIIHNIPDEEKYTYGTTWANEMNSLANVYAHEYDVFHNRTGNNYVFSDNVNAEDREIDFVEAEQEVGFYEPVIYVYTK